MKTAAEPSRERLPDRRVNETFSLRSEGLSYTATVSRFADGRVGEIFLSNHKSGSAADVNARDAAIACSIALQHGADVDVIRKALCRDARGKASGPLGVALDLLANPKSE
jgi:hypothetical protein